MKYCVSIYAPDTHLTYDLRTLNYVGIGGGVTTRIRIAHALKQIGCNVQLYINCPLNKINKSGVNYKHFSQLDYAQDCDIFIASTSGGDLDLGSLQLDKIDAKLKILFVHGITPPKNISLEEFDFYYVPSNFIRRLITEKWQIDHTKIFTCHRGVNQAFYNNSAIERDKFRLLYAGHPIKGLKSAVNVLRLLRTNDSRFTLRVFGSPKLWGEEETEEKKEAGVFFQGTVGQKFLGSFYQESSYSLFLQDIPEAFGISVIESMRAGCIPIASSVGALPETIFQGFNGLFVQGDHSDAKTQQAAADLILRLSTNNKYTKYLSGNGRQSVFDWQTIAKVYTEHWSRYLGLATQLTATLKNIECPECGGMTFTCSDGFHCRTCGNFVRNCENWLL